MSDTNEIEIEFAPGMAIVEQRRTSWTAAELLAAELPEPR